MVTVPLSSVITKNFITGFQNAASSASGSSSNPLAQSSSVSLSDSLRYGAQLYGTTIQNLNSVITFLNISQGTLDSLLELTDEMIQITDTATKRGMGNETRYDLNNQFRRLADDFLEIVKESSAEKRDPISIEDISSLFTLIGLDKEQSDSIANLFESFLTAPTDEDKLLASNEYLAKRPINIPADLSTIYKKAGSAEFTYNDSTNFPNPGASDNPTELISYDTNDDGILDLIGSFKGEAGHTSQLAIYLGTGGGDFAAEITTSDPFTGFSYGPMTILDFGADGVEDIVALSDAGYAMWALDGTPSGLVETAPSNTYSTYAVDSGHLLGDGSAKDFVYSLYMSGDIYVGSGEDYFVTTASSTILPASYSLTDFKLVDFNQDTKLDLVGGYTGLSNGFFVSIGNGDGTFATATMTDTATPGSDLIDQIALGDFNNDFKIDIVGQGRTGTTVSVALGDGATSFGTVTALTSNSTYAAVAVSDLNNDGNDDIIYNSSTTVGPNTYGLGMRLGNGDGTFASEQAIPSGLTYSSQGTISRILSYDVDGNGTNDLITTNTVSAGASTNVLNNTKTTTKIRAPIPSDNFTTIFDDERSITNRVEAYRLLTDLKSLREQLSGNLDTITDARDLIGKNMDLVRATGLALLELSDQITDATTAEEVANLVRQQIRSKASAALSQAENLTPLTVATLALSSSDLE